MPEEIIDVLIAFTTQLTMYAVNSDVSTYFDNTDVSNKDIFNYIKDNLDFDVLIWEFGDDSPNWVHCSYIAGKNRKLVFRNVLDSGLPKLIEYKEVKEKKYLSIANGMLDSLLRGLGIAGQAVSVGKNFLLDLYERSGRDRPEYVDSVWKLTQFSPPINSKISKLKQAAWHFDSKARREKIFNKGFALDNPAYEAGAKVISATTNVPLDRVLLKMENIEGALNEDNDLWQRIAMLGGWPKWQLETKNKKQSSSSKNNKKGNLKIKGGITFRKKKIKLK